MNKIKNYFSTPRKTIMSILKLLVIVICVGVCTIYTVSAVTEKTSIGSDNAKNFAFADAGVDPVDATNVKVDFEYKQGTFVYEVEFMANGVEYEYYVKSSDGSIVKKESEIIEVTTTDDNSMDISLDEAKSIALENVNLKESDVTFTKTKLDTDDGVTVYDIEFYTTTYEYEYEINATTGDIISKNIEERKTSSTNSSSSSNSSNSTSSSATSTTNITLAKAKSIALSDVNLKESDVTFTKTKLDTDDGITVYDIEFYTTTYEYEYEINATTGAIIEKDKEALKTSSSSSSNTSSNSYIGVDKAKSIAVNKAGLTVSSVTFSKTKLEKDDGIMVYEIEFYKDGIEYECTINAITGAIIEYEYDYD